MSPFNNVIICIDVKEYNFHEANSKSLDKNNIIFVNEPRTKRAHCF